MAGEEKGLSGVNEMRGMTLRCLVKNAVGCHKLLKLMGQVFMSIVAMQRANKNAKLSFNFRIKLLR